MLNKIRLLYFEGCPNYDDALSNVREVCNELKIPEDIIEIIEVNSIEDADKYRFLGSPTVQVGGNDIEESRINDIPVISCRLYAGNHNKGYPSKSMIKRAIMSS